MRRRFQLEVVGLPAQAAGHSAPLLMVHGGWHGAWAWQEHFMPYFSARGYDTHALSFRGHAGSAGAGRYMRSHRIRDYLDDLRQVVAQMPEPPVIIAHSLGAFVLQHYLAQPRARAAILLTPVPPTGLRRITWRAAVAYPFRFMFIHATRRLKPLVGRPELVRDLLFSEDMPAERIRAYQKRMSDESYRAFLDGLLLDLPSRPRPDIPCLVIGAAEDKLIAAEDVEATARFLGARMTMVDDIAHDVMLDRNWRTVADQILAFLQVHGI